MTRWRMLIASCIPKATNTHSKYVIVIAFPLPQCLHERTSKLRYTYIACPVLISTTSEPPRGLRQRLMEQAVGLLPRIKRLQRKADSRTRIRTEVRNAWNVVNISPRIVKALHLGDAIKNDVNLQYSNNPVRNSHRSKSLSIRNTNRRMFCREIMVA
jgi:hypothetical protein